MKKNITPFAGGISFLKKLNPINYDMKTDNDDKYLASLANAKPTKEQEKIDNEDLKIKLKKAIEKSKNQIGFSAQDLQIVLPQLVKTDDNGFLSVNYIGLIPVLVDAVKEQQKTIDAQAIIIDTMQKDIIAIKKKVGMQ